MMRLEILVPHEDARAVRQTLTKMGRDWTEQHKVQGGWSGHRYWRLWLMIPESALDRVVAAVRIAAPPRELTYHPHHGWAIDAWLHPTTVTLQGAVCTWWPVKTTVHD